MNKLKIILFGLSACCLLASCSGTKKTAAGAKTRTADYLIRQIESRQIQADWLDARAKIRFDGEDMAVSGTADITLRRDSLLWMSVRKLGFEVARVQITPDSIFVIDRLNGEYGAFGIEMAEKYYSLPANFSLLQSVILGNIHFFNPAALQVKTRELDYLLTEKGDEREVQYQLNSADFRLEQLFYLDRLKNRSMILKLQEYSDTEDEQLFSYFRTFKIDSEDTGSVNVDIRFSQVELNVPKRIRFEVPPRYKRMD